MKRLIQVIQKYDKISHFIVGVIFGIIGNFNLATTIFVGKEIYDEYKTNPTGIDYKDLICDYGGYALGQLIKQYIKI